MKARAAGALSEHAIIKPEDVFVERIKKTPTCWLWLGTKNEYGYGIFLMPGEIQVRAHRYSYEFFKGKIPRGKIIMHTCDNPPCVNPAHLKLGTKALNNADCAQKKRHNYGTDHWKGKLTKEDVFAIRKDDRTLRAIGEAYGITHQYVWNIKNRKERPNG